jgi:hypothetical protein
MMLSRDIPNLTTTEAVHFGVWNRLRFKPC